MADKQFAFGGTRNASYAEDDDPLAELARIVGYQEQPAAATRAEVEAPSIRRDPVVAEFPSVAAQPAPQQPLPQNPVADLEDELLRAFETYDDPRASAPLRPVAPPVAVAPPVVASPVPVAAPVIDEEEDPFGALAAVVAATAPAQASSAPAEYVAAPVARADSGFAPYAETPLQQVPRRSLATPVAPKPMAVAPVAAEPPVEPQAVEPEFSVDLLEAELMSSLDEATAQMDLGDIRDLGDHGAPASSVASRSDFSGRSEPGFTGGFAAVSEQPRPAADPRASWGGRVSQSREAPAIDSLLDDVARYDVPAERAGQAQRRDPAFDASLAAISGLAGPFSNAAAPAPVAVHAPDEPVQQVQSRVEPVAEVLADTVPDFGEMFAPSDFELDIDELELQLTDLSFDDEPVATPPDSVADQRREPFAEFVTESAARAAPAVSEPEAAAEPESEAEDDDDDDIPVIAFEIVRTNRPRDVAPEPEQVERHVPPVAAAPFTPSAYSAPTFEPVYQSAQSPVPGVEFDADPQARFDPAMLADAEDPVEALGEMDVPELEVHEPEEPAVVVPDYDLDIDAEMANLFNSLPAMNNSSPAATTPAQAAAISDFEARGARSGASVDAFDEFEKALEDDFRTMLNQPLGQPRPVSGMPIEPQMAATRASNSTTLRSILLAACATGALALVGLGGYMMLSHKSTAVTGEPRIIAADKGPVKVVPEDKGGVTVPNQDKAVYDRVAGHEVDPVKQGSLVTTEEQPVDVVQKTLVPDSAIDSEAEQDISSGVAPTPVEDTKDARLLPSDTAPALAGDDMPAAPQATAPGGVAVRKVKTMIVKADGTLVPREEPAPVSNATVEAPAAAAPVADVAPQAAAPAANTAADAVPADQAPAAVPAEPAAKAADLRTTAEKTVATETTASAESLASVANSDVQPVAPPVRVVKTAKVTDSAPIPTARPSDQPVNVVSTVTESGRVKPGASAAEPTQETASAEPVVAKPAASGSYGMQIASLPSEADAKVSIGKFAAKYAGVLGGRNIGIRRADIPGKGTYYRLRVDVGSKEQASALCARFKASGGSCLVSK